MSNSLNRKNLSKLQQLEESNRKKDDEIRILKEEKVKRDEELEGIKTQPANIKGNVTKVQHSTTQHRLNFAQLILQANEISEALKKADISEVRVSRNERKDHEIQLLTVKKLLKSKKN
ncbi:unnamed protein product [Ambrosiozyma monospora]|uniref:Unnamed protein product n=1 Tax=Ambrosiozyma monospora TaxID=43982 RepID=A0A9W6YVQ1_AMBMO|nr:unnamed protein product [Ambrosiozyma monospora]